MKLILIMNDQGGTEMRIEKTDVSPTLRAQDHGHLPIVMYEADNSLQLRLLQSSRDKRTLPKSEGGTGR